MKSNKVVWALTTLAALMMGGLAQPAGAVAATECPSYLEQVVSPVDFDTVAAKFSKLPKKDEFESTAQFENRLTDAMKDSPETYIVNAPFDTKNVIYDADAQRLRINSYAFETLLTDWGDVFGYGTPYYNQVKYGPLGHNIEVGISTSKLDNGSYQGVNAFGVRATVKSEGRITKAIFDRAAEPGEGLFFLPGAPVGHSPVIVDFEATPDLARKFKPKFRAAFVIAPKPPFTATGKIRRSGPTLDRPVDIDEFVVAVIADIQCALLTDDSHRVAASIPTR